MSVGLTIACVKWGRMYSACYANILYDMVSRNLPKDYPFTFICFTDDAADLLPDIVTRSLPEDLKSWWNKLYLFKKGVFAENERVVYLDLDTLITGPFEQIILYKGDFAILRDFYRPRGYGSGVMLWRAGMYSHIWEHFEAAGKPNMPGGDQAWIEKTCPRLDLLQDIFPGKFASFKVDCTPLPPKEARIVCFHGEPKQDNCNAPWVKSIWKLAGARTVNEEDLGAEDERARRKAYAASLHHPWISSIQAHERDAIIIGNGLSLRLTLEGLRSQENQMTLFAVGGSAQLLQKERISFDAHILKNDGEAILGDSIQRYYASTCVPEVFAKADGNITLWDPDDPLLNAATAGLCAMRIAFMLGYRKLHLVGFDSCYLDGRRQKDAERLSELLIEGRTFIVTPWMIMQAKEFFPLVKGMRDKGCEMIIYGDGLIPYLSQKRKAY